MGSICSRWCSMQANTLHLCSHKCNECVGCMSTLWRRAHQWGNLLDIVSIHQNAHLWVCFQTDLVRPELATSLPKILEEYLHCMLLMQYVLMMSTSVSVATGVCSIQLHAYGRWKAYAAHQSICNISRIGCYTRCAKIVTVTSNETSIVQQAWLCNALFTLGKIQHMWWNLSWSISLLPMTYSGEFGINGDSKPAGQLPIGSD